MCRLYVYYVGWIMYVSCSGGKCCDDTGCGVVCDAVCDVVCGVKSVCDMMVLWCCGLVYVGYVGLVRCTCSRVE